MPILVSGRSATHDRDQRLELIGVHPVPRKTVVHVAYKGHVLNAKYQPDLIVFGQIVVEWKAFKALASEHEAQLFNYLRISKRHVGYLMNFGSANELEWKRFVVTG